MKLAWVLVGMMLTGAAFAQVQRTANVNPQIATRNMQLADPQITQLKVQIGEQQTQINQLKKQNSDLAYCLAKLTARVDGLNKPEQDSVAVDKPAAFMNEYCQ